MPGAPSITLCILLAEDSDEDAFFFKHALELTQLKASIIRVTNAAEAIEYLEGTPPFSERAAHPFPDMIITDLKMPKADGFDLLRWRRSHPKCAVIPTIVLSASHIEGDVALAYELGANAFLTKPGTLAELKDLLLVTHMFWAHCQRPPPPPGLKCE